MPKKKPLASDISSAPKSPGKSGGFKTAEYNEVALSAQLVEIRLLKSNFVAEPEFSSVQDETNLSFGREVVSCFFKHGDPTVAAIFNYHVYGKRGRTKLLKCEAEYVVIYSVPTLAAEEAARGFCRNVGVFAAYPYFRAHVAQLAWGAGITLPPLPAIASTAHIPPKKRSEDAAAATIEQE
ncbi:hypothetical protein [Novosphingobium sp. Chol11]|uniref:hypothetical protein n=1 Tax=Novosphingobium sp. Chol11 TaxID=1385763 RepID=UPI0025ED4211|nr:hypothetical protein [Novosphingobium sp. Chol11]